MYVKITNQIDWFVLLVLKATPDSRLGSWNECLLWKSPHNALLSLLITSVCLSSEASCYLFVQIMHLSMLMERATHGILTQTAFPWDGILTLEYCPWVGNLVQRHVSYRKIFLRSGGIWLSLGAQGWGIWLWLLWKSQNPLGWPAPPPWGLTLTGALCSWCHATLCSGREGLVTIQTNQSGIFFPRSFRRYFDVFQFSLPYLWFWKQNSVDANGTFR